MSYLVCIRGRERPSNKLAILRANATVIHLGTIAIVKAGSSPTRRPTTAVEYNENIDETITAENISEACLFTSCLKHQMIQIELPVSIVESVFA